VSRTARQVVARPTAWFRIACQGVFVAIFVVLFALASFPVRGHLPVETFLRLDPLLTFVASLAARTALAGVLLAGAVLGSAVVAGRLFCGYVCPLGASLDFADFALFKRIRKAPPAGLGLSWVRCGLLAFIVAAALFGSTLLLWLSPLSLLTRFSTNLAFPILGRGLVGLGLATYRPVVGWMRPP